MAIAVRKKLNIKVGVPISGGEQLRLFVYEFDFDSSYPTGGEAWDISADLPTLIAVIPEMKGGYVFTYDYANKKLMAFWGDNNNAADGPLVEVTDTTNLSAVTGVRVIAIGY